MGTSYAFGQQAPQVHFIAKKQQFIAQISPEQLMNGDKRPFTTQSFNNFTANAKRATGIYGTSAKTNGAYNLANAAFVNNPAIYHLGSHTHTSGFNFHPAAGQKYNQSIYAEELKPKSKNLMGSSAGFAGQSNISDPYTSILNS